MTRSDDVPIASAYAVIPTKEEEVEIREQAIQTVHAVEQVDHIIGSDGASPNVESMIPAEAKELSWRDNFFDDEKDLIATFDLDYDSMERHYKALSWSCLAGFVMCVPNAIPCLLVGLVPCFLNKNVEWSVRAQHLAVTRKGIVYVQDQHPTMWGGSCCQERKSTRMIPFEQITDCTVTDEDGAKCTIGAALSVVTLNMPTSGSNINNNANKTVTKNVIKIPGLHDPHAFQKLILAMKRQQQRSYNYHPQTMSAAMPVTMDHIERQLENHGQGEDVADLLREIRDELRQHNNLLQSMQAPKDA